MKHRTGIEDHYVIKNNKKMQMGYTTGSCAAGAAKAATMMLLKHCEIQDIDLMTPKGIPLNLELLDIQKKENEVSCAIRKDGGDDPDATNGILVYAAASYADEPGVHIDGGIGVGRVTKPGLEQPVGNAAINRVPRQMITKEVTQVCEICGYTGGISIVISIPEGLEIGRRTFNPRLGIIGGISVLGTSGIVEPMSEIALIKSIEAEMHMILAKGNPYLLITPGNYGKTFIKEHMTIDAEQGMKCSNYVGETIDMAVAAEAKGILFVSHIGKFIKVAGGIMNTHSRHADSRAELMAAFAVRAGANLEQARTLLDCITTDECLSFLKEWNMIDAVMQLVVEKILFYLNHRAYDKLEIGVILFSNEYGFLGESKNAKALLEKFL